MKMTVSNEKILVEEIEVDGIVRSSIFLVGDADEITCSTVFDTPADSLVFSPKIPLVPINRGNSSKCEVK